MIAFPYLVPLHQQFSPEGCGNPTGVCRQAGERGLTPISPVCFPALNPADKTLCYPKPAQAGAEQQRQAYAQCIRERFERATDPYASLRGVRTKSGPLANGEQLWLQILITVVGAEITKRSNKSSLFNNWFGPLYEWVELLSDNHRKHFRSLFLRDRKPVPTVRTVPTLEKNPDYSGRRKALWPNNCIRTTIFGDDVVIGLQFLRMIQRIWMRLFLVHQPTSPYFDNFQGLCELRHEFVIRRYVGRQSFLKSILIALRFACLKLPTGILAKKNTAHQSSGYGHKARNHCLPIVNRIEPFCRPKSDQLTPNISNQQATARYNISSDVHYAASPNLLGGAS